jgi:hypothetical protein
MWRRVGLLQTDVSEKRVASIFKVQEKFSFSAFSALWTVVSLLATVKHFSTLA